MLAISPHMCAFVVAMAAKHCPPHDRDYIIILGCRFRKDGTLTPLLGGQVEAAIEFWEAERDTTGKEAVPIPTGGQGSDEVMAEAEAMRRHLISRGIPDHRIRVEDHSRNTCQNMAFSKAIINDPGTKIALATTNCHVFRSGVWASLAELPAEGIGSATKWWFQPNTFMRNCLGFQQNRWKQELAGLALPVGFFAVLSAVLV